MPGEIGNRDYRGDVDICLAAPYQTIARFVGIAAFSPKIIRRHFPVEKSSRDTPLAFPDANNGGTRYPLNGETLFDFDGINVDGHAVIPPDPQQYSHHNGEENEVRPQSETALCGIGIYMRSAAAGQDGSHPSRYRESNQCR